MPTAPSRARRRMTAALALMTATLVPGLAQIPALATSPTVASADLQHVVDGVVATLGDTVPGLSDLDLRGRVLPTAAQRSAADRLGAVTLRWNDFGTPGSLLPADGALARATSEDPVAAAIIAEPALLGESEDARPFTFGEHALDAFILVEKLLVERGDRIRGDLRASGQGRQNGEGGRA